MSYSINDVFTLLRDRANQAGISSNIPPTVFNEFWKRAELKFFNNEYKVYAETQVASDSISKWMSDPIILQLSASGRYDFVAGLNLLHVDSLSAFMAGDGTQIGSLGTLVGGSGYTNGAYSGGFTGGSGTGAQADFTISGGVVTAVVLTNLGSGYVVGDVLTAPVPGGTGFTINVASVVGTIPYEISRVEKGRLPPNLNSTFDAPNEEFPIYTQFSSWFQFYPTDLKVVQMVYLKQPLQSVWGYTLNGYVGTVSFTAGTGYTNGTYSRSLTGGTGAGAVATIVVAGGIVTSVTITTPGKLYKVADVLSASIPGGSGFSATVLTITNPRPIYNSGTSVQPLWNDYDISTIVDMTLSDIAINSRDGELANFANSTSKTQQ